MRRLMAFLLLSFVKIVSRIFYRGHFHWQTPKTKNPWKETRLIVFLNHTSLYEPLYIQTLPFSFLWQLSKNISVPGADITLKRPIVGRFWKLMIPNISSVSRKKDATWVRYLQTINQKATIIIAPEGRMKRPNGLDKYGKPMTVRGGVADIIENLHEGKMIICLSGGLHHIQSPGERFPKIFKDLHMNLFCLDIADYRKQFSSSPRERKLQIVNDLQNRLENDCPPLSEHL